jgi:hypothetical protein
MSASKYQYVPLEAARSIRVLRLKGSNVERYERPLAADVLEIELLDVSLESLPPYEAISYTWDGQRPEREVSCYGRSVYVTRNCESVLRRMRQGADRLVWIDSICIDQDSAAEKSDQIPLMGEIYQRSTRVLVWLGEGDEELNVAMSYMEAFAGIRLAGVSATSLGSMRPQSGSTWEGWPSHTQQQLLDLESEFRGEMEPY